MVPERAINIAKAVVTMSESDGWQAFVQLADALIASMTPEVSQFDAQKATVIASQMAFVSGIRRCIGLVQQQKDILASNKTE